MNSLLRVPEFDAIVLYEAVLVALWCWGGRDSRRARAGRNQNRTRRAATAGGRDRHG